MTHPVALADVCACGHTAHDHTATYGRCTRAACGCLRFRNPLPRPMLSLVTLRRGYP